MTLVKMSWKWGPGNRKALPDS